MRYRIKKETKPTLPTYGKYKAVAVHYQTIDSRQIAEEATRGMTISAGVDRMFREMAEAGNPAPEYKQIEFMLKVRLNSALRDEEETGKNDSDTVNVGVKVGVNERANEKVNEKVNERQKLIISAIFENPYITQTELARTLGISVVHVNKNMKKLQEQGLIRRVGPDKGGYWEVIERNEKGGE